MARAALTDDEIRAFRERAVAAATRLFAERGYDAVSMRAVAGELGVSAMTPYRYFANKDELFAAVKAAGFQRFADRQEAAATAADPARRLRELRAAYLRFGIDEPEAYRIMFELGQGSTEAYPELEAEQKRALSFLLSTVSELIDAGVMHGDPLTVAHHLWAQVHGLVSLHLAGRLIMGRSFDELCAFPDPTATPHS
jgi:AcrR family transcriptional regulator